MRPLLTGTKHSITTSAPVDPEMEKVVSKELSVLQASLGEPICITSVALDTKSKFIRFQEVCAFSSDTG